MTARSDEVTQTVATQKPSVGRIVLYRSPSEPGELPEDHPAIITGINPDGSVALHVFLRRGGFDLDFVSEATMLDDPPGDQYLGRWRWPARV